jgi:Na+/H+-dicarboxylate symporter
MIICRQLNKKMGGLQMVQFCKRQSMTTWILISLMLGLTVGYFIHAGLPDAKRATEVSSYINIVTDVFLRLIKMIIAPLVFSTLVVGIGHLGDSKSVGRVGAKALAWFITASIVSLTLGLILANWFSPGVGISLALPDVAAVTGIKTSSFSLQAFFTHLVPKSVAEAMATNEILQIVVFSIFFGTAITAVGNKAKYLLLVVEGLADVMLQITGAVMYMAPIAVFAATASIVTTQGIEVIVPLAKFMMGFYVGLLILWGLLIFAGYCFLGKAVFNLVKLVRSPFLLAFSTASSEAAYPKILEALDRFGVKRKISSFVMPMGYSFNLDGSMMYCTFAVLFIAQAYGIELSLGTQITMLLLLMLTSKGMAGVPKASLVVIAATLNQFDIPEAGLLLIMGVDTFLDMGRSATNAIGNSIATAVVAKWENGYMAHEETGLQEQSPAGPFVATHPH